MPDKSQNRHPLDRSIRERFETNDDWGIPDDRLWDVIEEQLPSDKKRRRGVWWLWGSVGLTIITGLFLYLNQNLNEKQSTKIDNFTISESKSILPLLPNETAQSSTNPIKNNVINNTRIESNTIEYGDNKTKSSQIGIIKTAISKITLNQKATSTRSPINVKGNEALGIPTFNKIRQEPRALSSNMKTSDEHTSEEDNKVSKTLIKVISTPTKIQNLVTQKPLSHNTPIAIQHPKGDVKSKWQLSIYTGINTMGSKLNVDHKSLLEPFDFYQDRQLGYNVGVVINRKLNSNWSLRSGLQYQRLRLLSGHNSVFQFDDGNEITQGNFKLSESVQSFRTPYGAVASNIIFARSASSTTPADGAIPFDVATTQTFDRINVPLGIEYQWSINQRWSVSALADCSVNYSFHHNTKLKEIAINDSLFDNHQSQLDSELNNLNAWNASLSGGIKASYNLSSGHKLYLQSSYIKDLRPMFASYSFSTTASSISLNAGIQVSLKSKN